MKVCQVLAQQKPRIVEHTVGTEAPIGTILRLYHVGAVYVELILLRVDTPASYSGDNRVGVNYLNHIEVAPVSGLLERNASRNTPSVAQVMIILGDWG